MPQQLVRRDISQQVRDKSKRVIDKIPLSDQLYDLLSFCLLIIIIAPVVFCVTKKKRRKTHKKLKNTSHTLTS